MKKIKYILITLLITTYALFASKSISIDLSKQKIYAKEDGEVVFSGSISSGKSGHRTPTGNFRILEKDRFHISDKYPEPNGGAKMPYMLRITNKGVAIHQGYLPGYPASHGCIRVSKSTAKKLWYWAHNGIKVRIYGDASDFKYVRKKVKKRKKHYVSKKRKQTKRRDIAKRRAYYKRRTSKKYISRSRTRDSYTIVEVYDSW